MNAEHVETEIIELHQFFQEWLNGNLPNTPATFSRFTSVMNDGFGIVAPTGQLTDLDKLTQQLQEAYGRSNQLRIWIDNYKLRRIDGYTALATYEEWQQLADEAPYGRLSTVVFLENRTLPNRLEWFHVHETWIQKPAA